MGADLVELVRALSRARLAFVSSGPPVREALATAGGAGGVGGLHVSARSIDHGVAVSETDVCAKTWQR